MNIVEYFQHTDDGQILMVGTMPDTNLENQIGNFKQGSARPGLDRYVDGLVVPIPPSPGTFYDFNYFYGSWEFNAEKALASVIKRRDELLAASDWTQNPTARLTPAKLAEWNSYRNILFDFPETVDLHNVVWPTKPTK